MPHAAEHPAFEAWIYDMDGLLAETESVWRSSELAVAAEIGIPLTVEDLPKTMGVRMREVADIWYGWHPWEGPTPAEVADRVIDTVIAGVQNAVPLPGVLASMELARSMGARLALCSSSDQKLIDAVLGALGFTDTFEVVHSAEHDEYGKPHPQPYLVTAQQLGVDPRACLVFEDSFNGCVSAKAAQMMAIAVPEPEQLGSPRFGVADLVLASLDDLTLDHVRSLA